MNKFDETAHMQMRHEQLKRLEVAVAQDNTTPSLMERVKFNVVLMEMRFCIWILASVYEMIMSVTNVFSRQPSNDFSLIEFKMVSLGMFLSSVRNKTERSNNVIDAFEVLLECVDQARRGQASVLTRIYDAGGVDSIENSDLRAEFDRMNMQVESIIRSVDAMHREVVTFRNIWRV